MSLTATLIRKKRYQYQNRKRRKIVHDLVDFNIVLLHSRLNMGDPNINTGSPVGYRHTINHEHGSQVLLQLLLLLLSLLSVY